MLPCIQEHITLSFCSRLDFKYLTKFYDLALNAVSSDRFLVSSGAVEKLNQNRRAGGVWCRSIIPASRIRNGLWPLHWVASLIGPSVAFRGLPSA
ncbi:hypothetical protein AVEN_263102-1 [Araneus ventricosus]|uniref:Uncharacterized protein n=1 Tax=Araneus ventricosus TaxID=182803 RepID=A0A4Y2TG09_ARAVE|nr:hypothetical protein AVEN_263102-1 [Araneus ventricosus]